MKDTPIQILDHIYYRDEASLESNKFRIASNDSQRMLDKNFSVCILSHDTKCLLIERKICCIDIFYPISADFKMTTQSISLHKGHKFILRPYITRYKEKSVAYGCVILLCR